MPSKHQTEILGQVQRAACHLESHGGEYSLSQLAKQANLSNEEMTALLRQYWFERDKLGLLNLSLTTAEETKMRSQ